MEELLNNPVVRVVLGLVVLVVVVKLVARLFSRPKTSAYHLRVSCPSCGWKGVVGKYNRRCNSCGGSSLETLNS